MPLGRYFVFVGGVLLALLFAADWYLPQPAATRARAELDRSTIRLHSRHRWPARIVIDTSLPTIVPPRATLAEAPADKPPAVIRSPREALAMASPAQAAAPAVERKSAPKRRTRTVYTSGFVAGSGAFGFRDVFPAGW